MNPDVILLLKEGYVRPLKVDDVHEGYIAGLNDPDVHRFLEGPRYNYQTFESVTDFVLFNKSSPNSILWGIWSDDNKHHAGTFRIHSIEHHHRTAGVGVCLFDKTAWGKGLGSQAIHAVTQWALKALNLRWIEAGIYLENVVSQKAFLSAGYVWTYDVPEKYLFDGFPTTVKFYVAKSKNV